MNAALIPAPGLRGQSLEIGPAPALHGEQPGSHFQLGQPNGAGCRTAAILHGVALRIALGKSSQARCPVSAAFSGPVETFLARQRERGRLVPRFVERELRSFLDCRILARGFFDGALRRLDRVVPYCKCRGFCPLCCGRRCCLRRGSISRGTPVCLRPSIHRRTQSGRSLPALASPRGLRPLPRPFRIETRQLYGELSG